MQTPEELEQWIDRHAVDKDGHRIGTIADVYIDDATGRPEWLAIMTGLFGSRISFAPLTGARERGDDVEVAYAKGVVKDSPNIEADGQLTEQEERRLYEHYGLSRSSPSSPGEGEEDSAGIGELSETGSTTVKAEVSPEVAQTRLRRRDAMSVEALDLESDDRP